MPLTDSLKEFWECSEASGSRAEDVNGYTLTDNGSVGSTTGLVYSLAANFSGSNRLSRASNADLQGGDRAWTLALWVKYTGAAGDNLAAIKGDSVNGSNLEYALRILGGSARLYYSTDGVSASSITGDSLSTNTWYLVWLYYDKPNGKLGVQVNTNTAVESSSSAPFSGTADFNLGGNAGDGINLAGSVGPAMFWTRLLDSTEKASVFNSNAGLTYAAMSGGGAAVKPWWQYATQQVIGRPF